MSRNLLKGRKTKDVLIRFPSALYDVVRALADREHRDVASTVRMMVNYAVNHYRPGCWVDEEITELTTYDRDAEELNNRIS